VAFVACAWCFEAGSEEQEAVKGGGLQQSPIILYNPSHSIKLPSEVLPDEGDGSLRGGVGGLSGQTAPVQC